jgi:hypothetical protein
MKSLAASPAAASGVSAEEPSLE